MERYRVNLSAAEIEKIELDEIQRVGMKFLAGNPGLLPSGRETPEAILQLIELGFVKEGTKLVGLEGESKSEFSLTEAGKIWRDKNIGE